MNKYTSLELNYKIKVLIEDSIIYKQNNQEVDLFKLEKNILDLLFELAPQYRLSATKSLHYIKYDE